MLRRFILVSLPVALLIWLGWRIRQTEVPHLQPEVTGRAVGVFHLHSDASHDSSLSPEAIAAVAEAQGVDFIILTDHNNQLAAPLQIGKVTVLSFAELSTPYGHLIQFGSPEVPSPDERKSEELTGHLLRQGGVPILSHPTDRKRPWEGRWDQAPGIEIANSASSARSRSGMAYTGLLPALAVWRFRPDLAWIQVYDRNHEALARWDERQSAEVFGICGADSHGRFSFDQEMRTWRLLLDSPLPEEHDARPAFIKEMLGKGRFHCVAGMFGRNPRFTFVARKNAETVGFSGDEVSRDAVDEFFIEAPTVDGDTTTIVLFRNGEEILRSRGEAMYYRRPRAGLYRIEIRMAVPNIAFGARSLPVVYSNRIRVTAPDAVPQASVEP